MFNSVSGLNISRFDNERFKPAAGLKSTLKEPPLKTESLERGPLETPGSPREHA